GVATLDRVQDLLVLVHVLGEQLDALAEHGPRQVAREAPVEMQELRDEDVVRRADLDRLMKAVVRPAPARRLRFRVEVDAVAVSQLDHPLERRAELPLHVVEDVELVLVDAARRELGGHAFELRAHLVGVANLTRRRRAHERTAMGPHLDETARLQLAERLADRRATDAELLGERRLSQPFPRHELTAQHSRLQGRGELVDERPALVGDLGHAGCSLARELSSVSFSPTVQTNTANTRRRVDAGSARASRAPPTAPTAPTTPKRSASPASPTPRRRRVSVPASAVGRITSSDVACAACCDRPAASVRNGTISVPPPTPSRPDATPATTPNATSAT